MYQEQHETKDGMVLYGVDMDGAKFITIQHLDGREHGYDQRSFMASFDHSLIEKDESKSGMVYTKRAVLTPAKWEKMLQRLITY